MNKFWKITIYIGLSFAIIATILRGLVAKKPLEHYAKIGHYVFIDDKGICHTSNNCHKLKNGKDRYGHSIYAMQPCDTTEFVFNSLKRICSNCVSIAEFEHLKIISERNQRYNEARKWIYNKLIKADYDMETYAEFDKNISDTEKRRQLHKAALDEGWSVGTFVEFSKKLGF